MLSFKLTSRSQDTANLFCIDQTVSKKINSRVKIDRKIDRSHEDIYHLSLSSDYVNYAKRRKFKKQLVTFFNFIFE